MIIRLVLFWDAYFAPVFFINLLIPFSFIHSLALTILLKFYLDARIIYCPVVPPILDLLSEALFASPFRPLTSWALDIGVTVLQLTRSLIDKLTNCFLVTLSPHSHHFKLSV